MIFISMKKSAYCKYPGEEENMVSIRYLAKKPVIEGTKECAPKLEDLYLWLFPEEEVE